MNKLALPFLTAGFRPFFLAAALVAIVNMLVWLAYLVGALELHSQFSPRFWHLHEMIFGFIGAAIAGFLLTAIPNWTSRAALNGGNLASLVAIWILGRVVVFYSEFTGAYFAAMADLPFFFILCLYIYREISIVGNKRNFPIVIVIFLFGVSNVLMHAENMWDIETAAYGYRLSIMLISTLIMLLGGRIIPNFTANWLKNIGEKRMPILMNKFDLFCIIWSLFSLLSWVVMPENEFTGYLLLVAGLLHAARLSRWQTKAIAHNPILLVLHSGYAWLIIGYLLLGFYIVFESDDYLIPMHALTLGAFSTMILAVMTRASLGHSGRKLEASKITIAAYICIHLAAISRIFANLIDSMSTPLLHISTSAWLICFCLFIYEYAPYFFRSRK